jgi:phospholipid/cholesterol/gamma-HCH transport system substrate-binding protein
METKAAAKVGLMVIVGAALLYLGWRFLSHTNPNHYTLYAVFNDVKGLTKQTPVKMNGVAVGEVGSVGFEDGSLKPKVTLAIDNKFQNRIPVDSQIYITSGILITNPQMEIKPGTSSVTYADNDYWKNVQAEPTGALAQLSPEADNAVKQLTLTIKTLTPKLSATMDNLQGILKRTDSAMANVEAISLNAKNLVSDPKIRQTMAATLDDFKAISHDARQTAHAMSVELRGVIKRNSGKFDELANGAVDLLQKFADTVDAARGAVTKLTEQVSDPRLQQSLIETIDLAKTTLARFNQIASDIHSLTGDPNVQGNLKSTVATLKETTEEGQKLVKRVSSLVDAIKPGNKPRLGIGRPELSIDLLARSNAPHFRSDLNLRVPVGDNNAFNLGIFDFAERYKLTAQYETTLQGFGAMRYGVYASKLGVGLNWGKSPGTNFRIDAYDPNNLKLDAKAVVKINNDFSFLLGADSIFKRTTPLVGVRLTR